MKIPRRIHILHVKCPDWMDKIAVYGAPLLWIDVVICLTISVSFWFILLLIVTPIAVPDTNEEKKQAKLKQWRQLNGLVKK